ncbi:MAG: YebC/PmpR family DNA-binding transcriptional regulator [Elusimicrobia bacterium]|nr:YebC/PmpR family DNA-binding transcriptional regulator [Elusimicrobiota bacterium]
MAGHSKWATTKRAKAVVDAKRGKLFTKIVREIIVATKEGGAVVENNPRLRKAIELAKEANMPQDNIKKAIQRGSGEIPGAVFEEMTYEGYGPSGIAVIVEITTDSKNRTAAEIRKIFSNSGGNLGETGSVGFMFDRKGYISIEKSQGTEEDIMNIALEAGADDFNADGEDFYAVYTQPEDLDKVRQAIKSKNIAISSAELQMIPKNYIKVEGETAAAVIKLIDNLEAHDDVKEVFANFDISKEDLEKLA